MVADNICCQMLCRHSLASLEDAVKTILGELNREPPNPMVVKVNQTKFANRANGADSSTCGAHCQAIISNSYGASLV